MTTATNVLTLPVDRGQYLKDLVSDYKLCQIRLEKAKEDFYRIEETLLAEVGHKEEGSFTTHIDDYKVTTTGKMTRKLDEKIWAKIAAHLPPTLVGMLIRNKPELNLRAFRDLEKANPDAYSIVAGAVITKPAKPTLKVEVAK